MSLKDEDCRNYAL